MALGVRLKKSLNGSKPFGRGKTGKLESNGNDSYRGRKSGKFESNDNDYYGGRKSGKFESNGNDSYRGRKSGKFESNGNDSYWGRSEREERKSLFTEKSFARKGRYSDIKTFGRKPINGRGRDLDRDESDEETRSRGANFDWRARRGKRRARGSENIPVRSEVIDQLRSRGRNMGRKQRDVNGNGSEEMTRRPPFRELRRTRGRERDDSRGGRVYGRSKGMDESADSDEETGSQGVDRQMRGHRGVRDGRDLRGTRRRERDGIQGGRVHDRSKEMDESADSVEASSDKLRLKWKKMDKKRRDTDEDHSGAERTSRLGEEDGGNRRGKGQKTDKGDAKEELLGQNTKSEGGGDQVAEQKAIRRQTRMLDKSGKKIRVGQTLSDEGSAEKDAPVKKKKRVMKIDKYDISNKRLDDSPPGGHADKREEKDSEISKNAQFRAIQPSPSILSFVEDNLLGRRRLNELKDAGYNIKLSAPLDNVPFSTSTERERVEENVFGNKLEFFAAAKISSSFPPPLLPEIAFAGRSNVGKSSLLNALTRQWGVVRTSDKPGLTQTINFFKLASKLSLVDLPGYGFAYAKDEVKEAWEELVKEYVSTREGLERVCLLVDTKWGMKPRDHELIDLMERSRTPYQIVLTKTDLVFPIDVARRAMQIQENLKKNKSIVNPVMMVSSKSGAGIRNLRSVLAKITRFVKP